MILRENITRRWFRSIQKIGLRPALVTTKNKNPKVAARMAAEEWRNERRGRVAMSFQNNRTTKVPKFYDKT
jgi:hypothetical protein